MKQINLNLLKMAAAFMVCSSLYAGTPKATPTPRLKPSPDTISSVSADSITVEHTKIKYPTTRVDLVGGGATLETSSKTYKITTHTEVTLSDRNAKVTDLQPGMVVAIQTDMSIAADADKSSAGVATRIDAKPAAPVKATPTPAKK
jgi:hypothetical protein